VCLSVYLYVCWFIYNVHLEVFWTLLQFDRSALTSDDNTTCYMFCTSGFVDDVMFSNSHNWARRRVCFVHAVGQWAAPWTKSAVCNCKIVEYNASSIVGRFLPQNFQCGKNPASSQTPVATVAAAGAPAPGSAPPGVLPLKWRGRVNEKGKTFVNNCLPACLEIWTKYVTHRVRPVYILFYFYHRISSMGKTQSK